MGVMLLGADRAADGDRETEGGRDIPGDQSIGSNWILRASGSSGGRGSSLDSA